MSASDQERFKTPDKGLAGAFERMMYGPDGTPKPPKLPKLPEPPKPRKSLAGAIGAVFAVAVMLAVLFGLAMGCLAAWQAVVG